MVTCPYEWKILEHVVKPKKKQQKTNEKPLAGNADTTYPGADGDAS